MRRVVITGIGALTPLGNDIKTTWNNLQEGRSGISHITRFDASALPSRIAGELKGFSPEKFLSKKDIMRLDPFVHYAAAAATMAVEDAGLLRQGPGYRGKGTGKGDRKSKVLESAAVIIGSGRGGITSMEEAVERNILHGRPFSAYLMSSSTINMAASYVSMIFGIKGPSLGISTACASGTNAIGEAYRMILTGASDIAIAGGTEAPICRLAIGGYGSSGALSKRNTEPERASRPFDRGRDGFVVSEGAGVIVLEEKSHAHRRGARIYAELAGYGASSDAYHQTRPDSDGEAEAVRKALDDAEVSVDDIDYINAHATSTPLGDAAEALAIRKVFGRAWEDISVSSCKSMLGHMLGAGGAVEAAVTALSIQTGIITPTINLEDQDAGVGLSIVTSTVQRDIRVALTHSFGFGGVNAVLVLKKLNS